MAAGYPTELDLEASDGAMRMPLDGKVTVLYYVAKIGALEETKGWSWSWSSQ